MLIMWRTYPPTLRTHFCVARATRVFAISIPRVPPARVVPCYARRSGCGASIPCMAIWARAWSLYREFKANRSECSPNGLAQKLSINNLVVYPAQHNYDLQHKFSCATFRAARTSCFHNAFHSFCGCLWIGGNQWRMAQRGASS